jgi:molecular chaperone HtpG
VLLLTEAIDELLVQALPEFEGNELKSIGAGTVDLGTETEREEARQKLDEKAKDYEAFMERLKGSLEDRVAEVRLSPRLTASPACLVGGEDQFSPRLEKWLREERDLPVSKRILELNPDHPVVAALKGRFDADAADAVLADYAELLYGYALLAEGSELPDPAGFARRFASLMEKGLSASPD